MSLGVELRSAWWACLLPTLLGCSSPDGRGNDGASTPLLAFAGSASSPSAGAPSSIPPGDAPDAAAAPRPACAVAVPVFEAGRQVGEVCEDGASAAGLTIVDLSGTWAPRVFAGDGEQGPVPYRDTYVRLAREDFGDDPSWDRARADRWFELYGIWPTFSRVGERLADRERHACHAALDREGLAALDEPIDTWRPLAAQRADRLKARALERRLGAVAAERHVSIDDLATEAAHGVEVRAFRRLRGRERAIRGLQEHLRCDRLLGPTAEAGVLDTATIEGMQAWFRRHMVVAWQLDLDVRDLLLEDSRELDLRQALRALRARVVDASGLIEDGTAAGVRGTVAGRVLDTAVFSRSPGEPLGGEAAPDLVARATDAAARALGWTSPDEVASRIAEGLPPRVAVRLPAAPPYHRPHMDLVAVIDRGDVVLDPPGSRGAVVAEAQRKELPSLTLVARHEGAEVALVRFPTTIGGWQPEVLPGSRRVQLVYKESPVGPRLWRDLVAAPAWIPPASTPARDLMRPTRGGFTPKLDTFGPHYASAFGLAMLVHHGEDPASGQLVDRGGIRTHGSASYGSIFEGTSHGCHRLHNHRAIELAGFLLAHRNHVVRGPMQLDHVRTFAFRGRPVRLEFPSRGFRYELDPPVAIEVLEGRLQGERSSTRTPAPLPPHLARRYAW